ncbi:hypothetical protein [Hamadaea tsunoensis]|uniref:hypothetical protein n=1 Tax=Hamadaea tsunoensis TaxID=53368 RepID=UPI0003F5E564|nr:hypothetical protein [Hamadaea tsunoensis]
MRSARRLAAGIGLGLLLGLPLLAAPALAAGDEGQTQVEFNGGGLGLLLCGSRPNTSAVTIKSESKVVFVNNLGQGATLQIDGENGGPITDGQAVEVQFHRGPVAVAMVPDCLLDLGGNGSYEPVTVNVTSASPSGGKTASSPHTVKPRTSPKPRSSASAAAAAATPSAEASLDAPLLPLDPSDGTTDPSGDFGATDPAVAPDGTPVTSLTAGDTPTDKGPIGLLAIIATVCVVGVSVGAIRVIVSQRATRAEFA